MEIEILQDVSIDDNVLYEVLEVHLSIIAPFIKEENLLILN